jgi:hypothetical protein
MRRAIVRVRNTRLRLLGADVFPAESGCLSAASGIEQLKRGARPKGLVPLFFAVCRGKR